MFFLYLGILLERDIDSNLITKLYDTVMIISVVNFAYFCSNMPLSPAYGVLVPQLNRYAREG